MHSETRIGVGVGNSWSRVSASTTSFVQLDTEVGIARCLAGVACRHSRANVPSICLMICGIGSRRDRTVSIEDRGTEARMDTKRLHFQFEQTHRIRSKLAQTYWKIELSFS